MLQGVYTFSGLVEMWEQLMSLSCFPEASTHLATASLVPGCSGFELVWCRLSIIEVITYSTYQIVLLNIIFSKIAKISIILINYIIYIINCVQIICLYM